MLETPALLRQRLESGSREFYWIYFKVYLQKYSIPDRANMKINRWKYKRKLLRACVCLCVCVIKYPISLSAACERLFFLICRTMTILWRWTQNTAKCVPPIFMWLGYRSDLTALEPASFGCFMTPWQSRFQEIFQPNSFTRADSSLLWWCWTWMATLRSHPPMPSPQQPWRCAWPSCCAQTWRPL